MKKKEGRRRIIGQAQNEKSQLENLTQINLKLKEKNTNLTNQVNKLKEEIT